MKKGDIAYPWKGVSKRNIQDPCEGEKSYPGDSHSDEKQFTPRKSERNFHSEKSRATMQQLEHENDCLLQQREHKAEMTGFCCLE